MTTTEPTTTRCAGCGVFFSDRSSSTECPHKSLAETPKLRALREAGPPYKLEPWKQAEAER